MYRAINDSAIVNFIFILILWFRLNFLCNRVRKKINVKLLFSEQIINHNRLVKGKIFKSRSLFMRTDQFHSILIYFNHNGQEKIFFQTNFAKTMLFGLVCKWWLPLFHKCLHWHWLKWQVCIEITMYAFLITFTDTTE